MTFISSVGLLPDQSWYISFGFVDIFSEHEVRSEITIKLSKSFFIIVFSWTYFRVILPTTRIYSHVLSTHHDHLARLAHVFRVLLRLFFKLISNITIKVKNQRDS